MLNQIQWQMTKNYKAEKTIHLKNPSDEAVSSYHVNLIFSFILMSFDSL